MGSVTLQTRSDLWLLLFLRSDGSLYLLLVPLQVLVVLCALGGAELVFLPLVLSLSPSSLTSLGLSWALWVCQVDWLCCEVLPPDFSFVLTDVDGCK